MYRKNIKEEFYTRKAKEEGYPARSVYKLQEIDEKYGIIKNGGRVLDLGSAPGSWLLYISQKVGERGRVVGIDIEDIKIPLKNNMVFIKKDIADLDNIELKELTGNFQVVVSDLSPKTSGINFLDAGKSLELCEKVLGLTTSALVSGGNFVCKVFESELTDRFFKKIKSNFKFVKKFRPKAVIKGSKEIYIVAKDFKR